MARYNYKTYSDIVDASELNNIIDGEFYQWYASKVHRDKNGNIVSDFASEELAKIAFIKSKPAYERFIKRENKQGWNLEYEDGNLYLVSPIKKSRKYSIELDGDVREALENKLLEMYLKVLTSDTNVDETKLPLDNTTSIIKNEVLPIVNGPKDNKHEYSFKYVSPTFQLNKKYEYSGGKSGIAPFALNNVHHVLTQLMSLNFKPNKLLKMFGFGSLDGINSREVVDYKRSEYGEILKDENGDPIEELDRGERILDWISAMINAHVDVAKDPYVIQLNVVQWTYNMADFLLRSGYGRDTFFFLPQPILKDIAAEVQKINGNYGVDSTKTKTELENDAIASIIEKYQKMAKALAKTESEAIEIDIILSEDMFENLSFRSVLNRDFLINNLRLGRAQDRTYEFYKNQLMIWRVYEALTPYAKELSELVHLSQIDTKKFGNNFNLQRRFLYRLKSFILNNTVFNKNDLVKFFKNSFLDTKIRNSIIFNNNLFNGLMITSTNQFINQIEDLLGMINQRTTRDERLLKIVANELEAGIKSDFFMKYVADNNINIMDMFYGENNMAARLSRLKNDILLGKYPDLLSTEGAIKNELLTYLGSEFKQIGELYDSPNIITVSRSKTNDKNIEMRLKKYWTELLNSPHEDISKFAKDLVVYAFFTSGDNFNKNSFFNLVPTWYRKEMGYADAVESAIDMLNQDNFQNDLNDIFRNTWYNNNLVREIRMPKKYVASRQKIGDLSYPVVFIGTQKPIGKNRKGQPVYRPYVKINLDSSNNPKTTVLYKYLGYYIDKDDNIQPIYGAINKKGLYLNGKVVREYNGESNSILSFNNLPYSVEDGNIFEISTEKDKNGNEVKRYKNLAFVNKKDVELWRSMLPMMDVVNDYVVDDIAETKSYDDVMNYDFDDVNQQTENETESVEMESSPKQEIVENFVVESGSSESNKFTFPNGMTIATPFPLNAQQKDALTELAKFLDRPQDYDNEITLTGYAGTGKTTIMGLFHQYIIATQPEYPKYAAVTYRANAVTKMNNPEADTYTLNQLFGISSEISLDNPDLDVKDIVNNKVSKGKIESFDLVIIDEASMVSPAFYEFVQEAKKNEGIKVIYVGDPAQLSPVDGSKDISPVFNSKKGKVLQLTKVERTGDNPILNEATNLRNGEELSYTTNINSKGEGVYYTNSKNEANGFVKKYFNSEEFKNNKLYFRILSATNAEIPDINNTVRESIFGKDAPQLVVGDILMGYDNIMVGSSKSPTIINSGDYEVIKVEPIKITFSLSTKGDIYNLRQITVDGFKTTLKDIINPNSKEFTVDIASNRIPVSIVNDVSTELQLLYSKKRTAFALKQYAVAKEITEFMNKINGSFISMKDYEQGGRTKLKKALDYGYCHSVHKSQGGTYNNVLFYLDTVQKFKSLLTQRQLKYVAITRAKEQVVVLTEHKLGTPTINNTTDPNINNTDNTNNDPVNFNDQTTSEVILTSDRTILTNEELRKIRPFSGENPRIAVASEHTDPVFFADKIIRILDGTDNVADKFRNTTYSGKDFAALYLITKHDGLPLKKLLEYKIPKLIHFSITGLGGTKYEPGVMKPDDLLDRIAEFIKQGLDPEMITVRIDPIIPGVTSLEMIEHIIKRSSEMGIKNIRFSVMDQYKTTKQFMENLGYDYSKFYEPGKLHAKDSVLKAIAKAMAGFKDKYDINLSTCAEPFDIPGISKEACLSVPAVNKMLGTSIPDTATGKQRALCSCYGGKTDLLKYDNKCASSCVYCYAHHNTDKNTLYYNEDGTLKDIPLTQTVKKQIEESSKTENKSTDVLRNKNGEPIVLYRGYAMTEDREATDIDETVAGTASDYAEGIDAKYHFTTSREEAEDYSKTRTDKSAEPTAEGKINRHYTGDFAKVSAYHISANAKVAVFDDLRDFNRNKDSEKVKNADVIALRKGTLHGAPEYIVKSSAKSLIVKANIEQSKPKDAFAQLKEEEVTQTIEQFAEEWSKKEGWSVEYFNEKVLPRIREAWQIEYKLAPDQGVQVAPNHTATMNFNYGNSKRSDVNSTSTIEAIKNGERTATTRYESDGYIDFWKGMKKGDVVKFIKRNSKKEVVDEVKVIITKPLTKLEAPIQQPVQQTTQKSAQDIFDSMMMGSDEISPQVQGNSLQNLVTTNDEALKRMLTDVRRNEMEQIIQQRTDIDANAFRSEFEAVVEQYKNSNSDALNNALMRLLCSK